MQYGIGPDELLRLIDYCKGKGALSAKLTDLGLLYGAFLDHIKDSFITTEETMDLLASKLDASQLIKNSVVVFDGFTGFTPVQMKVVGKLMSICEMVYITLTLERDQAHNTDSLFAFTNKSYEAIMKLAGQCDTQIYKAHICENGYRFSGKPDLAHLERHLFRYPPTAYDAVPKRLEMYEAFDVMEEVRHLASRIHDLTVSGAQYRDIAVITGNMDSYESHIRRVFESFDIPFYIDKTRAIVLNPFVEHIKSMLRVFLTDFDRESVFRYLRSGMCDFDADKVDRFENYCLKTNFRGLKRYQSPVPVKDDEELGRMIEELRSDMIEGIEPLLFVGISPSRRLSAATYVRALYDCCEKNDIYAKLRKYEDSFREEDNFTKEKEYSQIYRLTMELFEQIYALLGEEEITLEEFIDILEAGFEEITVGTIPQSVDRVIVGDMERSRLKPVRYLFFIGLNDGYVPGKSSKCSILSDMEREYLAENDMDLELAPTPRQKMFIHRFYMYSNLVKPSDRLFMSYSMTDNEGKSLRPAYIVPVIRNMFPKLALEKTVGRRALKDIDNIEELKEYVCDLIRRYAQTGLDKTDHDELMRAISLLLSLGDEGNRTLLEMFISNSFYSYSDERLDPRIAGLLYGERLLASISRMEQFASCAYAYFLRYGLSLKEREEYGLDDRDMGSIFHEALRIYGDTIGHKGMNWTEVSPEESEEIMRTALRESVISQGRPMDECRVDEYIYKRMAKTFAKAVNVLTYQIGAGEYKVSALEVAFERHGTLDEINVALDKQEKIVLNGRIDRIDTLDKGDVTYVKVIDYKTGNKDFSLINLYYGLQLQLVVYMSEGMRRMAAKDRDRRIEPGALLYYRVADKTVDAAGETDEEKINDLIKESLRAKGLINSDTDNVYGLTGIKSGKSDVVKIGLNTDGTFTRGSSVASVDELRLLCDYADFKLRSIGNDIISGRISKTPVREDERKNSCTYCAYSKVCGFDQRLDGYHMSWLKKMSDDEVYDAIRHDLEAEI